MARNVEVSGHEEWAVVGSNKTVRVVSKMLETALAGIGMAERKCPNVPNAPGQTIG